MNNDYEQFHLLRFTSKKDLTEFVEAFCELTHLSGGVVAMPEDPKNPPKNEEEFKRYRLTDPQAINQFPFCRYVRACNAGNAECMWSDLKEARAAMAKGKAISYPCHLGLTTLWLR